MASVHDYKRLENKLIHKIKKRGYFRRCFYCRCF